MRDKGEVNEGMEREGRIRKMRSGLYVLENESYSHDE